MRVNRLKLEEDRRIKDNRIKDVTNLLKLKNKKQMIIIEHNQKYKKSFQTKKGK